jgi:hypothetical protein
MAKFLLKVMIEFRYLPLSFSILISLSSLVWAEETQSISKNRGEIPSPVSQNESLPHVSSILGFPRYQLHQPEWAFQFSYSPKAFSGQALTPQQAGNPTYAYQLGIEYQPKFLQKFGVIGLGPTASLYSFPNTRVTSNFYSVSSYGGRIRYQARYFREQIIVPVVSYSWEILNYSFVDPSTGAATFKDKTQLEGPTYGLWILINPLDRRSANSLYLNTGITRTYLTLEGKQEKATVSQVSINSWSYFAGLRLEL